MTGAPLVEMRAIEKRFGGVKALDRVELDVTAGEVVGVLGHNGAGKSVLMNILAGALSPDQGEILIDGAKVAFAGPRDARACGIEIIYQNLALAENLDAAANLFLGREITGRFGLLDDRAMAEAALAAVRRLNPAFTDVATPVHTLSGGQRQAVAIARAVHFNARVLIMDEPTAALGPAESEALNGLVRRLKADGLAILMVSHDLHDVFELADRVVVLKNGRLVGARRTAEVDRDEVLRMIVSGA